VKLNYPARAVALVVAGVALLAPACGTSSTPAMSSQAERQLQAQVEAVRSAAENRDRTHADLALSELRTSVATLLRDGEVTATKANAILAAAADVETQLAAIPTTTTTPVTTPAPPPSQEDHEGKGHGKGD
jgi:phage-related minor tail protein